MTGREQATRDVAKHMEEMLTLLRDHAKHENPIWPALLSVGCDSLIARLQSLKAQLQPSGDINM